MCAFKGTVVKYLKHSEKSVYVITICMFYIQIYIH